MDLVRWPLGIHVSDSLESYPLTLNIDPKTNRKLHLLVTASKVLYCLFPSQPEVRTQSLALNSEIGWLLISMRGLPLPGVLV